MIILTIDIEPEPYKKTRQGKTWHGKKVFYNPQHKYLEHIKWQVKPYAPEIPLEGPLALDITFYLKIPKSTSGIRKRQMLNGKIYHIKRPDVDNLAYPVTNALKGIIYKDDSQIVDQSIHKRYNDKPKIVVKITDLIDSAGDTPWLKV